MLVLLRARGKKLKCEQIQTVTVAPRRTGRTARLLAIGHSIATPFAFVCRASVHGGRAPGRDPPPRIRMSRDRQTAYGYAVPTPTDRRPDADAVGAARGHLQLKAR